MQAIKPAPIAANLVAAALAAALVVLGTAASLAPARAQPTGNPARGQHLFMADGCYECHGTVGQGGAGPRLAPDPLPADAIASYIRKPANVMPPYVEKVLNDQGVRDIQAYLAGIKPPKPLTDIPLLAQ